MPSEKTPEVPVTTPEVVKEEVPVPPVEGKVETPEVPAEMDKLLSHRDRILAFVAKRRGTGKVKLNDFLKSLYPFSKELQKPEYTEQGKMKKLRKDLRELQAEGKIVFINDSFQRLGQPHFPDQSTGKTHYFDISNLSIEVQI